MAVREAINKSPAVGIAGVVALIALAATVYFAFGRPATPARADRAFFSDDDGASFFEDVSSRLSGSDHNGKPAYRAYVFQCGSGKQFVGYLERGATGQPPPAAASVSVAPTYTTREIKQPGGSKWLRATDPGFSEALQIHCPGGSNDPIQPISP